MKPKAIKTVTQSLTGTTVPNRLTAEGAKQLCQDDEAEEVPELRVAFRHDG